MGVANRDFDASEKNYVISAVGGAQAVSVSLYVGIVPSAGNVLALQVGGRGLSGTPWYQLNAYRFTSAGVTVVPIGSALTLPAELGISTAPIGATYVGGSYVVQAGDLLGLVSGGANTAVTAITVDVVIQATQDIKKSCGV
jgi:hypothetical protein